MLTWANIRRCKRDVGALINSQINGEDLTVPVKEEATTEISGAAKLIIFGPAKGG